MALKKTEVLDLDILDHLVVDKLRRIFKLEDEVFITRLAVHDSYRHY